MQNAIFHVHTYRCRHMHDDKRENEYIEKEIKEWAKITHVILEKNVCNMIGKKKKNSFRPEFWRDLPEDAMTLYGLDAHSVKELEENYLFLQSGEFL